MAGRRSNTPWNKGDLVGQKPPLRPISEQVELTSAPRQKALFRQCA
jgi:hypothetical protein